MTNKEIPEKMGGYKQLPQTQRLQAIDNEITEVKQMIDDTYNVEKQIRLSKCLVTLYTLKKEVLGV